MKTVIQRVSQASVTIDYKIVAEIQIGLVVLVGIEDADLQEDVDWLCQKIANLRIFGDENKVPPLGTWPLYLKKHNVMLPLRDVQWYFFRKKKSHRGL